MQSDIKQLDQSNLKAWFLASRPRTLPVSFVPIIVGTVLSSGYVETINWSLLLIALICSLLIQIGTNLVNDAIDFKKGADRDDRLGPLRVTQKGLLSYKQVLVGGCTCFILALLCGIPLMWMGGWPLGVILVLSVACGYLYTGGPYPLAYIGFSDLFVLIFFGWVSTCAIFFLQTGMVNAPCFLAATQIGLLAMVPHAINNLRDIASDARVQKKTIAVRFGIRFARFEISILSYAPFFLGLLWIGFGNLWMGLLPLFALPSIMKNVQLIWKTSPSPAFNQLLAKSAICQLRFGGLLALGSLIGG